MDVAEVKITSDFVNQTPTHIEITHAISKIEQEFKNQIIGELNHNSLNQSQILKIKNCWRKKVMLISYLGIDLNLPKSPSQAFRNIERLSIVLFVERVNPWPKVISPGWVFFFDRPLDIEMNSNLTPSI